MRFDGLPKEGLEPSPSCEDGILNPARLPIPPLRPVRINVSVGVRDVNTGAARGWQRWRIARQRRPRAVVPLVPSLDYRHATT
jgi:hypothetical protein